MLVFHSYVSLPEGNGKKGCCVFFAATADFTISVFVLRKQEFNRFGAQCHPAIPPRFMPKAHRPRKRPKHVLSMGKTQAVVFHNKRLGAAV
jgi:hypothetical protein